MLRAWRFLAKVAVAIAALKVLVNLFSFKSQSGALHSQSDVPIVAYAITLTRIPEGIEGHTIMDAVEVSEHHFEAVRKAQCECSNIGVILFVQFTGFGPLD
jgi:hypothetical protein